MTQLPEKAEMAGLAELPEAEAEAEAVALRLVRAVLVAMVVLDQLERQGQQAVCTEAVAVEVAVAVLSQEQPAALAPPVL